MFRPRITKQARSERDAYGDALGVGYLSH